MLNKCRLLSITVQSHTARKCWIWNSNLFPNSRAWPQSCFGTLSWYFSFTALFPSYLPIVISLPSSHLRFCNREYAVSQLPRPSRDLTHEEMLNCRLLIEWLCDWLNLYYILNFLWSLKNNWDHLRCPGFTQIFIGFSMPIKGIPKLINLNTN